MGANHVKKEKIYLSRAEKRELFKKNDSLQRSIASREKICYNPIEIRDRVTYGLFRFF